jgi:sugar lactone lactonase YvrE
MRKKVFSWLLSLVMTAAGIMAGATAVYAEDDYLTREEFYALAGRLMLPGSAVSTEFALPFEDAAVIDPDNAPYIYAMHRMQIATGIMADGVLLFKPAEPVTRQEAVRILGMVIAAQPTGTAPNCADAADLSPCSTDFVAFFLENGLIENEPDGSFNPTGRVGSAAALTLINNTLKYIEAGPAEADIPAGSSYVPGKDITVSAFAGIGSAGANIGSNNAAMFNLPQAVFARNKELFVIDTFNNLIRRLSATRTTAYTGGIRGTDDRGFPMGYYVDGRLSEALFNRPTDGVANNRGQLFITDSKNHAIRTVSNRGVHTFAGGIAGHQDGSARNAQFNTPTAIAADNKGNLYVADTLNHAIRMISASGRVSTVAGLPGVAGYADGNEKTALFNSPSGIAVSGDGSVIYVADTGNHRIRMIRRGVTETLAGAEAGKDQDGDPVGGFRDSVGSAALFNLPMGITLENQILIIADSANHRIRGYGLDCGNVITIAGTGEPGDLYGYALEAEFNMPKGVLVHDSMLYITDTGNNKIKRMPLDAALFN